MTTIPASAIVAVTPSVLSAGGSGLELKGLLLTHSARVPINSVANFGNADDVGRYFGLSSDEYAAAKIYFGGFSISTIKPESVLFAQYNAAPVSGWLRGGSVAALTLTQLQAIAGTLTVSIDGTPATGTVNLSAATSFSNAAEILGVDLSIDGVQAAAFTGAIAGTNLTVSAVTSGTIAAAQVLHGAGVSANTYIVSQTSGTPGGIGVYVVSTTQTVSSEAMTSDQPGVYYDSIAGAFVINSGTTGASSTVDFATGAAAATLMLTQATGAVQSPGAIAAVPNTFMFNVKQTTQNWASFTTLFDPDAGSGNANKKLFSNWVNGENNRWCYFCWDPDAAPKTTVPATTSMGYYLEQGNVSGTCLISEPDYQKAVFGCGFPASLDFTELNGRSTFAFKSQSGQFADVIDETTLDNLVANGYNSYGAYATANDLFTFMYPGTVSGDFQWLDSYVNQIWLNNGIQLALMTLLVNVKSLPYNRAGYALVEAAVLDPILAALNFGAIRAGVTLSEAQKAEVNSQAGVKIDNTLSERGWYFQIIDAQPITRQARQSPPCKLFYMDGESIQQINIASILVQ